MASLNLEHTLKFLDIAINELKAIECLESFMEAVIMSASTDKKETEPTHALFELLYRLRELPNSASFAKGVSDSLVGDDMDADAYFNRVAALNEETDS